MGVIRIEEVRKIRSQAILAQSLGGKATDRRKTKKEMSERLAHSESGAKGRGTAKSRLLPS
jgi:hypothetical protein